MSAPTKDPHVAMIDAHEELLRIRMAIRVAVETLKKKREQGYQLTTDDLRELAIFKQKAIDATRRVQDKLLEELEAHGGMPFGGQSN